MDKQEIRMRSLELAAKISGPTKAENVVEIAKTFEAYVNQDAKPTLTVKPQ